MLFSSNLETTTSPQLKVDKANQLAISQHIPEAIKIAQELYENYPKNQEVIGLNAKLYFWSGDVTTAYHYSQKLQDKTTKLYTNIITSYEISLLKNLKNPKDKLLKIESLDSKLQQNYTVLIVTIQSYLKLNNLEIAKEYATKLVSLYPESEEAKTMLANIKKWEKNSLKSTAIKEDMVGVGYRYGTNSSHSMKEKTKYLEFSTNVKSYDIYVELLNSEKFNLVDNSINVELYLHQNNPYWGFVSFGMTDNANFSSKYFVSWHQYVVVSNWQFATSYKYAKYTDTHSNIATLEYAYYLSDYLYFKQTLYYSLPTKSSALSTELHYKAPNHLEWFLNYTLAKSKEEVASSTTLLTTDTNSYKAKVEYPLNSSFSLGCEFSYDENRNKNLNSTNKVMGVFIRSYL